MLRMHIVIPVAAANLLLELEIPISEFTDFILKKYTSS